jgi:bacillithiol biosynthesis deacetylase BshB1
VVERCDVLAVGAHPDDVEIGGGGTLARLAARGVRIGIVDLSSGELGTRGDVPTRRREAETAASILGAAWRTCLGLPDGGVRADDPAHLEAVVGTLRAAAPRAVFVPHPADPHPDHGAAARLLLQGSVVANLARFRPELGSAHRVRLVLAYPGPRQLIEPTLVVDIGAHAAGKRRALAAHTSQFDPQAGSPTQLASGYFLAAIEGRDRAYGNLIGCEFGEGFVSFGAVSADELVWLLRGGDADTGRRTPDPGAGGRGR